MQRNLVAELHYITPIRNLESILSNGILSHVLAEEVEHESIADPAVQDRRENRRVPGGRMLHEYANLYFDARNAMMYRRYGHGDRLMVVRVDPEVMDLPGAVIADGNAASGDTRFFRSPDGLVHLDEERVFAESWNHADYWEKAERKRQRQAEVLVPDVVDPEYITGCYTLGEAQRRECRAAAPDWTVEVNRVVFFR